MSRSSITGKNIGSKLRKPKKCPSDDSAGVQEALSSNRINEHRHGAHSNSDSPRGDAFSLVEFGQSSSIT